MKNLKESCAELLVHPAYGYKLNLFKVLSIFYEEIIVNHSRIISYYILDLKNSDQKHFRILNKSYNIVDFKEILIRILIKYFH